MELFAGLRSQIKSLKDRLKALDTAKKNQKEVKEVVDALNALEERYTKEREKREEKKKLKMEKSNEKASEESKEAPKETVEASESTSVEKEAVPDIMPDTGSNWPELLKNKKEHKPMDPEKKKEVVKNVEDKLGPAIISKYNVDDKVEPIRGGEGSWGHVMRPSGINGDPLVYVKWMEGPLKDKHGEYGGYYEHDLKKKSEEVKPQHCPCWEDKSKYCPECKSHKTSDLKSNYMDMLKDLKDEHKEALDKHDHIWVSRLEQKIKDLEAKIQEMFGNEKQSDIIDHPSGTERLVTIDQTPPGDKANYNPDGGTSSSEYQDELAMPSGSNRNLNSTNKCVICDLEFKSWPEYDEHRKMHLEKSKTSALKVNVFNRDWNVTPIAKDSSLSYDISDSEGKKLMNLKPASGKEWSTAELQAALKNELQKGFKQAKLVNKIAFLPVGSKVTILSTSKDGKTAKFASIEHGVRGTTSTSNFKLLALESQKVQHGSHSDPVLGASSTETLLDCVNEGPIWVSSTELLDANRPPATPESLNLEEAKEHKVYQCQTCPKIFNTYEELKEHEKLPPPTKKSAKECPDCHGNFTGAEGEKCPTCGRFAVKALKTALPPTIPNERAYLDNPPVDKQADEEDYDKPNEEDIFIQSEGSLGSNTVAYQGRKPIAELHDDWEAFYTEIKNWMEANSWFPTVWQVSDHGNVHLDTGFIEWMNKNQFKTSSLNKQAHIKHEDGKWVVYSHDYSKKLGTYPTKEKALKRLRQIEFYKNASVRPFSKKTAEILTDPYQALHTQVQTLRDRMSLVQERLQSNPLPKEAGEGEKDNSEMDIPTLLEDLSMGIDLLETKLQGNEVEQDAHPALEEMENLLWSVEEKLGITPKLSEEEKAEPEHSKIVKDLEKESAVSCPACGARLHDRKAGAKCEECGTPVPEDLIVKEATTTPTSPVSPSSPMSPGTSTQTPATPTDKDKPTCALCGGMQFADFAKYQNHMEYTHASDTMPTSPSQKNLSTTVGSKKKAADVTLTDESIEDKLTDQPVTDSTTQLMPVPQVPTPQNVQPTDDDNLEIPTQAPTSKLPQGQKWTYDAANGKFVAMTDPTVSPGKII